MMQNLDYYKRLVTSEYRHSPRFTAMVQKLLSYGLDIDNSINNMLLAFEVDNASTAQLDILGQIVDHCCLTMPFASPQANRIAGRIYDQYHVAPDFPWKSRNNKDNGVFRHLDSGKWFGLIMNGRRGLVTKDGDEQNVDIINLKSNTLPVDGQSVFPAYHMNHKYWVSVVLDDQLGDDDVMRLIDESFRLTGKQG